MHGLDSEVLAEHTFPPVAGYTRFFSPRRPQPSPPLCDAITSVLAGAPLAHSISGSDVTVNMIHTVRVSYVGRRSVFEMFSKAKKDRVGRFDRAGRPYPSRGESLPALYLTGTESSPKVGFLPFCREDPRSASLDKLDTRTAVKTRLLGSTT